MSLQNSRNEFKLTLTLLIMLSKLVLFYYIFCLEGIFIHLSLLWGKYNLRWIVIILFGNIKSGLSSQYSPETLPLDTLFQYQLYKKLPLDNYNTSQFRANALLHTHDHPSAILPYKCLYIGGLVCRDEMLKSMPNISLALHLLNEKCSSSSFWEPYISNCMYNAVNVHSLYWNIQTSCLTCSHCHSISLSTSCCCCRVPHAWVSNKMLHLCSTY